MSKADKTEAALDQAMKDALASVERIEKERDTNSPAEATVEVHDSESASAEPAQKAAPAPDARVTDLTREVESLREQLLRMAADFDNFRKRTRREQDDIRRYGIDRLLGDVLPITDNLDRALSHSEESQDPVIVGVRMVAKQFHDVLSGHGVKPFASEGQAFDPEKHEAVGQEELAEHAGRVVREMQRGYMIHERLLRPARVMVAVAPADKGNRGN